MNIVLPYLDKTLPLEFPDENLLAVAEPNEYTAKGSAKELLAAALAKPCGPAGGEGEGLGRFLYGGSRVLIIINDATRPTPTALILEGLLPLIEQAGVPDGGLTLLTATGAHRGPTEEEYRQILGNLYPRLRSRCLYHDARNEQDMVDIGTTRNGTPMLLNRQLFAADRIIATGSVEPHYFAGFTGGRKAFLPGIASYKTIQANHKLALSPRARSLALEGNPVHEDMMDALPLIKAPVFSVMTVLDREQGVAAVSAGDLMASFYSATDIARKIFCVAVPSRADIVVSVAKFPMDIDLYQSQKAIDNGALALKDGGTLILVSSCRDGIGDEAYAALLAASASPAEAIERIRGGYKLGYHKAAKMAEVSGRAGIMAVSELPAERLASMFIEKSESPQQALDKALAKALAAGNFRPKILILPDGCVTVPDPEPRETLL
ncbi:MAG: nickel-dependent lactate racemase [Spirochaetaceae bacterium]|jgi:nickel-dependent lactate racemase|nr:nickel-dependent lactate racemase [Spirochaetaceae bacterium]